MSSAVRDVAVRPVDHRGGWRIVAAKELADHLLSARFTILMILLALAGLAAVDSAADQVRELASVADAAPTVFLLLFTVSPDRIPSFMELIGFLGPLLGIAFGFDAVNNERAAGTLPRLVSQPIHRDDVITGKVAAGVGLIAVSITALVAVVSGYGIVQLGITPEAGDMARIVTFVVVSVVYVTVWLAFAVLLSTITRRAATAVLTAIATWLVVTLFAGLIFGAIADVISPVGDRPSAQDLIDNAQTEIVISRISPEQLYNEVATAMLNPQVRTIGIVLPQQVDQAIPDTLPWDQSLLLVWSHVTALVTVTVLLFVAAFLVFMRQEVRA